jgi:hypothetical protein
LLQHNTSTGSQNRINIAIAAGQVNGNVSTDGAAIVNNGYATAVFADLGWHWCESLFFAVGAGNTDRLKQFIDFTEIARSAGVGTIPTSIFNATAKIGIACRFQGALANVDTTDWAAAFYCNGIPSLANRQRLANGTRPIAALL